MMIVKDASHSIEWNIVNEPCQEEPGPSVD